MRRCLTTCLKGSDLISWHRTSRDKFKTQKSPQGLCRAGFQDFCGRLWNRRERILVGWRSLNWLCNLLFYNF